jgi:hypothetical protein
MFARFSALLIWAAVVVSMVYWGRKLLAQPPATPAQPAVAIPSLPDSRDWLPLLGATPTATPEPTWPSRPEGSRFRLLGVVAPRPAAAHLEGVALIEVDGKLPRVYRTGAVIDGEHVLLSVHPRAAAIGPLGSEAKVMLELPPLPLPTPAAGVTGAPPIPPTAPTPPPAVSLPPGASNSAPSGQLAPPKTGSAPSAEATPAPAANPGMFPAGRRKPAAALPPASPLGTVPPDPDP